MDNTGHPADVSTVVAVISLGAILACGLMTVCATLFGADKMPLVYFWVRVVVSVLVLAGFGALAFFLSKGWIGKRWRIPSRYLWSGLLLLIAVSLPVAAAFHRDVLVLELSIVPLIFMVYLLRCTLLRSAEPGRPWEYHFIEHLSDESTVVREGRGSVVKKLRKAESGTMFAEAIFEHPPQVDDTVIQFSVVGAPEHVGRLRLEGNYGILEKFEDDDGQLKISKFPIRAGNKVRFEVRIDQRSILLDERDDYGWVPIECPEALIPHKGGLLVELRTNCLGDPSWNWAAWGELKLVEWK